MTASGRWCREGVPGFSNVGLAAATAVVLFALSGCGDDGGGPGEAPSAGSSTSGSAPATSATGGTGGDGDGGSGGDPATTASAGGAGGEAPEPRCGDGEEDPGEACDDGNDVDGDGCNSACVASGTLEDLWLVEGPADPVYVVERDGGHLATAACEVVGSTLYDGIVVSFDAAGEVTSHVAFDSELDPAAHDFAVGLAALDGGDVVTAVRSESIRTLARVRPDGEVAWALHEDAEATWCLAKDADDRLYVGGQGESWLRSYTSGGAVRWTVASPGQTAKLAAAAPLPGGGVIAASLVLGAEDVRDHVLTAVDADGDVLWDAPLGQGERFLSVQDVAIAADGGAYTLLSFLEASATVTIIRRHTADGELLWDLRTPDLVAGHVLRPSTVKAHPAGGFVMTGRANVPVDGSDDQLALIRFDDDGNVIWDTVLETPGKDAWPTSILFDAEGRLLVGGSLYGTANELAVHFFAP